MVQKAIAQDYRADPAMATSCKEDVEKYCKDIKEGGGRKAACLVSCHPPAAFLHRAPCPVCVTVICKP